MRLWQRAMIGLARSRRLQAFMQSRAATASLARRFVGGGDLGEALETCRRLARDGIRASLFWMGEYVADPAVVERTVEHARAAARALGAAGLDVHVSLDPTQIGHLVSPDLMRDNAIAVGRAVLQASRSRPGSGVDVVMLDMEDETLVTDTISLYEELVDRGLPAAVTVQAYLRRTAGDLEVLLASPGRVRLVKGAFAARPEIAFTGREEIRHSFSRLARLMLSDEAKAAGFYPSFATHDHRLLEELGDLARARGWPPDRYEIEMLFGVRPELQRELVRRGHRVRAYVPFGEEWWPYAVRRVGESAGNLTLLALALGSALVPGRVAGP
jgi:proline dehydrogenase